MTETALDKASRLLANKSVQVKFATEHVVSAAVRGDSGVWDCRWTRDQGWECTCPAYGRGCSHVLAVAAVTMQPVSVASS